MHAYGCCVDTQACLPVTATVKQTLGPLSIALQYNTFQLFTKPGIAPVSLPTQDGFPGHLVLGSCTGHEGRKRWANGYGLYITYSVVIQVQRGQAV